ncbi:MAG: molybdopterin-dependent oxidoreductase, partial [Desulfobacterales bacterium]|nr:molybdopterin-dependent oxidoreductase [Desulfobacterales bacterium]
IDDGVDHSWLTIFEKMYEKKIKGFFSWGQNPACSGANANKTRESMKNLDWMVTVNLFDNETSSFWRGPGVNPKEIKTEVFLLPCAASFEKEGSITNSGRWMQWRYKAVSPPGEAMSDADIINILLNRLKKFYAKEKSVFPDPILKLRWEYGPKDSKGNIKHIDIPMVAKEINGYFVEDKIIKGKIYSKGMLVPNFTLLQDDGSTSSGCWIYSGSYTEEGNMAARRGKDDPSGIGLYPDWSWTWPLNRRIIYNRASVDKNGKPWAPHKPVIEWENNVWKGDVADGGLPPMASGKPSCYPFITQVDGVGHIFGPGLVDGPFPEHYEPLESPLDENLLSKQLVNPIVKRFDIVKGNEKINARASHDPRFPIICTTYRLIEHWQTGVMTRWQPWLVEMEPSLCVEIGGDLAEQKGIKQGDKVIVKSARGDLEAIAMVTVRWRPFRILDRLVHQVGLPYHYGWATTAERKYGKIDKKPEFFTYGDSVNILTPNIGDANTMVPESKCFMVDIVKKV